MTLCFWHRLIVLIVSSLQKSFSCQVTSPKSSQFCTSTILIRSIVSITRLSSLKSFAASMSGGQTYRMMSCDLMMKMQDEWRLLWTKSTGADFRTNHPITVEMLLPGTTWRTDQWINLSFLQPLVAIKWFKVM